MIYTMNKTGFFLCGLFVIVLFITSSGCIESQVQKTETVLTKLDGSGTTVWNRSFDNNQYSSARSATISNTVIETKDRGFLIAGRFSDTSGKESIRLIKTDRDGKPAWDTTIPVESAGLDYLSVAETSSGGYWIISITGSTYLFNKSGGMTGIREISPQLPGNADRATTYSGFPPVLIYRISWAPDGGAIMLVRNHADIYQPFILIGVAENGTVIWNTTPDQDLLPRANSIIMTRDGGFLWGITGEGSQMAEQNIALVKTDRYANMVWNVTFNGRQPCEQCIDVLLGLHQSEDGSYEALYLESEINVTHPNETRQFILKADIDDGGTIINGNGSYGNTLPDWIWDEATVPQKIIYWTSENLPSPITINTFTRNRAYQMNDLIKTYDGGYVTVGTVYYY